jgi:hypothetical protein
MESSPKTLRPLAPISPMMENNSSGVVGPFKEIGEYVAKAAQPLHTKG